MLSSLHIKTVVKTLSEYRLVDKEYVVQAAYNHLNHASKTVWQGVLDNITYKMEDEIGLEPSEYKNADLLLNKLQLKHKGHLFPWHILALSKIYLRYSKKLNSENISEKDQIAITAKATAILEQHQKLDIHTQFLLILKYALDLYLKDKNDEDFKSESYEKFLKSKRMVSTLEISELNIAIQAVIELLEGSEDALLFIRDFLLKIKEILLYFQANIDFRQLGLKDSYWAITQIKKLSAIKMYFIDQDSGKKSFFANGFRQDYIDGLVDKLLSSISIDEIKIMSIDEKLDYIYTGIETTLSLKNSTDNKPDVVLLPNVNPKFIALIILGNIEKSLRKLDVEWMLEFSNLYEHLLKKYTTSTMTRAKNIQKPFASSKNSIYYHRYLDECLECVEIP